MNTSIIAGISKRFIGRVRVFTQKIESPINID